MPARNRTSKKNFKAAMQKKGLPLILKQHASFHSSNKIIILFESKKKKLA
jgi:hypothetical protein